MPLSGTSSTRSGTTLPATTARRNPESHARGSRRASSRKIQLAVSSLGTEAPTAIAATRKNASTFCTDTIEAAGGRTMPAWRHMTAASPAADTAQPVPRNAARISENV